MTSLADGVRVVPGPAARRLAVILALAACAAPACTADERAGGERAGNERAGEPTDGAALVLTGTIRAYIVDNADGTSRTGYALERGPSDHVELAPSADLATHVGRRVTLTAHRPPPTAGGAPRTAGGTLRAAGGGPLTAGDDQPLEVASLITHVGDAPATTAAAHVGGPGAATATHVGDSDPPATVAHVGGAPTTVRVAIVLLNFQGVTAQSFTPTDARARLATVRAYYQELSYGTWTIEPTVFGPYTVARPTECSLDTIGALARQAATSAGVAIGDFAHVGVTLPDNGASGLDCACGLAWLGRTPAQADPGVMHTSLYTCTDPNAFAHEIGHGFGLHHASTANCQGQAMRRGLHDACAISEYGNQFNTMGNGLGHMNGFQKSTMRWLNACNHVRASRDATFDLVPIQSTSTGVQTLQLATGDTRDGNALYYYVEYRNPALATFNAGGNQPREQGVGVHIDVAPGVTDADGDRRPIILDLSPGTPGSYTDPRLTAGRSFADPDGRVTVRVLETAPDKARVQVTFPGGGGGLNTCIDGSPAPGSDGPAAGATLYQHCAFGGWAVALAAGDYTRDQLVAAGAVDNDASSLQLQPGYEATLFDGPDFTGESITLTAASDCLVPAGWNDRLSSLRLRAPIGTDVDAGIGDDAGGTDDDAGNAADGDGAAGCGCQSGGGGGAAAGLALALVALVTPGRRRRRRRH